MGTKNTHFPTEPVIKINGTRIKPAITGGTEAFDADASTKDKKTGTTTILVTKDKPRVFKYGAVLTIEALVDSYSTEKDASSSTYSNRPTYDTTKDFVGKVNKIGTTVNDKVEIFYTVNGKDPQKTKSYLYTGPLTFANNRLHDTTTDSGQAKRKNNTGGGASSDNIVVKARTYYHGRWSAMAIAEFKIVPQTGASK